ncbi:MAG: DUF736 domain-containing protein [Phenylobacterium sp.]|uniref:DUF736 domain-containing protein n=1 Tax=Phenylobacterium sp. TaxID=1871053 RepID=UPI0011FB60E5|nr:DUF736 domain-containing protein [Phenylobacterium sp.]TAJ71795.1 MAG: DUF736 domain-containing protein [Phenylobacterium sp.]
MTTIGTFTKTPDGRFQGAIRTLTLNVKCVEIRPVEPTAEKAPDHRVFIGQTEVGAAWTVSRDGKPPCLSVRIDDPSLPAPLQAFLVDAGDVHHLNWSRQSPR